jgi:hypothetical protein
VKPRFIALCHFIGDRLDVFRQKLIHLMEVENVGLGNSLMVPRRLRLVMWREDSGCPINGSTISGRDLASTAVLISEREQSTNAFSLPTLAGNFDGEPNQRLKNARIVFGYFAQNTFQTSIKLLAPIDQRLDFIVSQTNQPGPIMRFPKPY